MELFLQSFQIKTTSIFEALMLVCFGASWPFAVYKTWQTKNVTSKSRLFLSFVILGYVCGIIHKILHTMDAVFWLYVLNLSLVAADLGLVLRYRVAKVSAE